MIGKKYDYAMTQLEIQGVLHPDVNMFAHEDFYQTKPNVVIAIMTQLSLKTSLKEWGDNAHSASKSEMKQLHRENTFMPMHAMKMFSINLHSFFCQGSGVCAKSRGEEEEKFILIIYI